MRCSLLSISSYLDGELSPERSGELEAHLVACSRCSNGLGYLREEKERIRTLMAVHAREGAAEELLATVGLVAAPETPQHVEPQSPPQFLLDLPDTGKAAAAPDTTGPDTLELPGTAMPKPAANGTNGKAAPAPAPPPVEEIAPAEPADTAPAPEVAPAPEATPPAAEVTPPPPQMAAPPAHDDVAPPPAPLHTPRPSSWFERARDTIALRWALMRGVEMDDDEDDGFQIISGAGAPPRPTSRSVERPARTVGPADEPVVAAAESRSFDPEAAPTEPEAYEPPDEPIPAPDDAIDPRMVWPQLRPRAVEPQPEPERAPVVPPLAFRDYGTDSYHPSTPPPDEPEPSPAAPVPPPARSIPAGDSTAPQQAPAGSGRHMRALHGGGRTFKLPAVPFPRPRPAGARSPLGSPLGDRRLWIFGATVVILALIGLLLGKHVTQPVNPNLAAGAVPNPTAIALPSASAHAPTAAATPVPTPAPTATPTAAPTATPAPRPAQPNPANLTGVQTLGSGASGVQVQDLRYGEHPNDFRIVFDLSGSATPTTQVGFGNPTTLYVEFSGVTGGTAPAQPPAGQTATTVKLLQPSPIAGKTVYEITLAKPSTLATSYLLSPTRLVIDLG